MKSVRVSAPGKLLLLGDHAVVYGYPCLVTAVNERMTLTLEPSLDGALHMDTPGVTDTRFLETALRNGLAHWHETMPAITIRTSSGFSGQYGFGSSAAVTVALLFALRELFQKQESLKDIFALAFKTVIDVQGVGSGFDVAAAAWGGTLWYEKRGERIEPVHHEDMPLIVGYTGTKADTSSIVKEIAEKYAAQKDRVERIFQAMGQLVLDARVKIEEGDWERVGTLMDFNQEYLRDLGVSSEKLETMISAAKRAGAWGAKLSGAGRGDSMIALAPKEKREAVEQAIEAVGGKVIHITPAAKGVETTP